MFLKGSKDQIELISKVFGYHYKYNKRTNDYAHPSVLYFYNQKITNYLEGVAFDLNAFDYSVMQSKPNQSQKKIITYCYYFDPDNQTYSCIFLTLCVLHA